MSNAAKADGASLCLSVNLYVVAYILVGSSWIQRVSSAKWASSFDMRLCEMLDEGLVDKMDERCGMGMRRG